MTADFLSQGGSFYSQILGVRLRAANMRMSGSMRQIIIHEKDRGIKWLKKEVRQLRLSKESNFEN